MNYCSNCGSTVKRRVPPGDDRPRYVCDNCHRVYYDNPKVVVGCIPEWEDRILLCRRAIEPRKGFWTVPAGFLEIGETLSEGAERETLEEANARVEILAPFTLLDITHAGQAYLIFRGRLLDTDFTPGDESLEVDLFSEDEIPWSEIAFTSIIASLRFYFKDRRTGNFSFHTGRILPDRQNPSDPFREILEESREFSCSWGK